MKKRSLILVSFILSLLFGSSILTQNTQAYFKTSKDNNTQCFAVQYIYKETTNAPGIGEGYVRTKAYSTAQVCAPVNNGVVNGKLSASTKTDNLKDITVMSHPRLEITGTSDEVRVVGCPDGGRWCSSSKEVTLGRVKVSEHNTFKSLAQAVWAILPNNYNNDKSTTKQSLDQAVTTTPDLQKEANKETSQNVAESGLLNDGSLEKCQSGGAKALGWVVCPIIEWAGNAAESVYNDYVEPSLNIEPQLFSGDGGVLQQAWGTFRDIANIIFVILFLVVIFSQLTGVGIDNYGIKRILPKLIIAAILINLSYFICILAVDISNILGNSFQALFDSMGADLGTHLKIPDSSVDQEIESTAGSIVGLSVLGALAGMTGAIWATPAVILALLVGAVGVVVSIFFLFILLAAREAAIIVLIVVAPVAVVLYALPNTKKIFDKWVDLFKGLLLVYPIAGLLVGAGDYVSALLLKVGGGESFFSALTAMVVGVLPIFFIPTVLKSAFSAMGNLGAKISGFGQRIGSGATRAARSSSMYQGLQDRAGKFAVKQRAEMGKKYALGDGGYARFRRGMLGGTRGIAADIAMTKKAEADEVGNYMTFINDRTRNGEDEEALKNIYEGFMGSENKAGAVAAARIAGRRKDTAANFAKHYTNNKENYNPEIARSIAKEIATGENSANYRAATPLAFEYASQVNSGKTSDNYGEWTNNKQNIADALEHHVTNTQELVGMKGSSLKEINDLIAQNKVDDATKARLQNLALQTIENRNEANAPWDTTKAGQVAILSGQYKYDSGTDTLTKI